MTSSPDEPGQPTPPAPAAASSWAPFRHAPFATLWGATVVSNMGMWMNDVGAGWLMTDLNPSPQMVALVQAATTLPVFLFALLAGAIADLVDRRRMLLVINALTLLCAAAFTALVLADKVTIEVLLVFTFLLGTGAAFMAPAWQAIVPRLVPRADLPAAVALNSMGINVARAIGPALAGMIIVPLGIATLFALNAVSRIGILAALCWWSPAKGSANALPPEPIGQAVFTGLRYAARSTPLKATLARALCFFLFASLYWAMLPLIAREQLRGGPATYGLLMAMIGLGAVIGAFALPAMRRKLKPGGLVLAGSVGTAVAMTLFGLGQHVSLGVIGALIAGASWLAVLSTLNVSVQSSLPDWVRARGLAVFITVYYGAMAAGSLAWGQVAAHIGVANALLASAAVLVLVGLWATRFGLPDDKAPDLAASAHWPQVLPQLEFDRDRGPVMVEITYHVDTADRPGFLKAIYAFREERYRDGAYDWNVFEDVEVPGHFTEYFLVGSWLDHLRQHDRVTVADKELQSAVASFHSGDGPPKVRHLLAPQVDGRKPG
ncbi:MFS transporter [Aminobacter aganoensis]|uniref:MFS family permease n=1 Tax=Aminobacter aganoensis TaxID=83264 RepID=A0A7X0KKR9_9HYPH|nr:MFS transporter [Aminobacter aganoensis]MBB6354300.1 MFS family permease [Aminobacter aganoensis]